MDEKQQYNEAVQMIKTAILQSQYDAARSVNEKQLMLYYGIGKYISSNSRNGFWGKGAIDAISEQLNRELPGLRGFSARNLRNMRGFYEEWKVLEQNDSTPHLADTSAKMEKVLIPIWQTQMPNYSLQRYEQVLRGLCDPGLCQTDGSCNIYNIKGYV